MLTPDRSPGLPDHAPTLTDGRVLLRAHRPEDAAAVLEQCRDEAMGRWTTIPWPYTAEHATEFVAGRPDGWRSGRNLAFAIETGGRFAGTVDLRPDGSLAEIGFGLSRWARGQGVMSAAVRLVLGWAFDELGLDTVRWEANRGNWASRRVAWSTGFRFDGTIRAALDHRGQREDAWVATLRRGEPLRPVQPWYDPPVLAGPGFVLRPHRPDDAARMAEACDDPESRRWLPFLPSPYTEDDARRHLDVDIPTAHAEARGVLWALADPADDRLIGELGVHLRGPDRPPRAAEIGYWTHPRARGRGLTAAAVRRVAEYALLPADDGGLGLDRLLVRASAGNTASQRVALAAGFRPAGRDRGTLLLRDGTVADDVRFDRLRGDPVAGPAEHPGGAGR